MSPKVSVIIPTFNRGNYLTQTIESVLSQTYENFEVIVANNCSTDNTKEVVNKFLEIDNFIYFENSTNIGMVKNWHKALHDYSSGEWFMILSDDDYLIDDNYLMKCMTLQQEEKINLIYANGYIKNEITNQMMELLLPFESIEDGKNILLKFNQIKPQNFTLCNVLFNREKALQFNPFTNEFNIGCDSELFLNLCSIGKVGCIKEFVSVYRVHGTNLIKQNSISWDLFIQNHEYLLKPYVDFKNKSIFSSEEINLFERKVVFPYLKGTFIFTKLNFFNQYDNYVKFLKQIDPVLLNRMLSFYKYDMRIILIKIPIIYKKFMKITKLLKEK